MNIALLGSGSVAQALSPKLRELGHDVRVGTRDPEVTKARDTAPWPGAPTFAEWHAEHPDIEVVTFAEAARDVELIIVAVTGSQAVGALGAVDAADLEGATVLDVTNPMTYTETGARMDASDDDSIAEQLQRAHPAVRVVKSLNTVAAPLMVSPTALADGDHSIFLSGDDDQAKGLVRELVESFGWSHVIDLGDLSTARGVEQYMGLWLRLYGAMGGPMTNVRVVSA